MHNLHVKLLTLLLLGGGLVFAWFKIHLLGLPLRPNQEATVWTVEARVEFQGGNRPAVVDLDLPDEYGRHEIVDEYFVSSGYGHTVHTRNGDRRTEWSIRRARGTQYLFYQVALVPASEASLAAAARDAPPPPVSRPDYEEPLRSAIEALLGKVRGESADIFTFAGHLLLELNRPGANSGYEIISKDLARGSREWVERIQYVLAGAQIPSRLVRGITLESGKVNDELTPWLEVHNGQRWEGFNPLTGERGYPPNFALWSIGDLPLVRVNGGDNVHVRFAVADRPQATLDVAQRRAERSYPRLLAWSLYSLPLNTQYVYRILVMIPLGALIVIALRIFVGVTTFGTFMPILIAIAFRETQLAWGIGLFCIIVGAGLSLRFYLERLRLLLVSRLTAVLILVIMLMLAISVLSNQLGLLQGFSIALFPIVILTMVIERMSITWDELGPLEAFKQGFGTLFVAVLGYLAMTNPTLQYLMFTFPELLLVLLALAILTGSYTGYRLTELFRFKDLATEAEQNAGTGTKTS
ncbi:MAG: UUP1 family membrane protein [Gammaproteobacteria bacterium]|nr:UUP1 family membrane protein [Gammaproteobacteria bacterium]